MLKSWRARLNLLKPDTDAKILKVKMAQELHTALSAGEDVLRNMRKSDIIVSIRVKDYQVHDVKLDKNVIRVEALSEFIKMFLIAALCGKRILAP
jgi:hypothetical protein